MSNAVVTESQRVGIAQLGTDILRGHARLTALRDQLKVAAPMSPVIPELNALLADQERQACTCENLASDFPAPLDMGEVAGYTRMARNPIVFRLYLSGLTLAQNVTAMGAPLGTTNKVRFADLGKTRDGETYGLPGGEKLTAYHTPWEHDGTFAKGKQAEIYGFKVKVRATDFSTPAASDLQKLEDAKVYWVEASVPRTIGYLGDLFVPNGDEREDYQYGGGLVFPRVLSTVRGGKTRDSFIEIDFPKSDRKLSKGYRLDWEAIGPAYERSTVTTSG